MSVTYKDSRSLWKQFLKNIYIIHGPDIRLIGRIVDMMSHMEGDQDVIDFLKVEEIEKPTYIIGQANIEVTVKETYFIRPSGITYLQEFVR